MIKANELRIGNLVYLPTIEKTIVVGYHHIRYATINPDNEYEPIPLTPEILRRCGFFETSTDGEFIYNERGIIKININNIGLISFNVGEIIFSTVHYLHQLQNLYFTLTGEELEINNYKVFISGAETKDFIKDDTVITLNEYWK
jgi:hypothetical protein